MRSRVAWVIVLGLLLAGGWSAPLRAQTSGLPETYSFASTNSFVGEGATVIVKRNGSRELIETSAGSQFHTTTLYDFQARRLYTLDLSSRICTTQQYVSAFAPPMLDPVGGAAEMQSQLAANRPKSFSTDVVNGIRTKVATLDSPEGKSRIWLDEKFSFLVKMAGPMGGKDNTAFEMRQLSYAPSPAALFTTPTGCKEIAGASSATGGHAEMAVDVSVQGQKSLSGATPAASRPAAAPAPQAVPAPSAAANPPVQVAAAPAPQSSAAVSVQPDFTVLKSDFVPGDKTLFYDDFTDMTADDAPPHFKIRGAAPQLKAAGNIRQMTINQRGSMFPNLTSLPNNFTWEGEIKADVPPGRAGFTMMLASKGKQILHWAWSAQEKQVDLIVSLRTPYQELGRKRVAVNLGEPVKLALWVQNGRMRSFLNGEKQLDFNQVDMPPIDSIEFANDTAGAGASFGYRSMRFAESTPDFSQVINSSGRFVSYGIRFDTDSDRLKPESAAVIKQIAHALEVNPALKLRIEGHTDSVGDAAHNLDLSRRRAAAVMTVLTGQFNVEAARLSAAGLGATKPVDSNDTPQGRAQNRRVEFVKQ